MSLIHPGESTYRVTVSVHLSINAPDEAVAVAMAVGSLSLPLSVSVAAKPRIMTNVVRETAEVLAAEAQAMNDLSAQFRTGPRRI